MTNAAPRILPLSHLINAVRGLSDEKFSLYLDNARLTHSCLRLLNRASIIAAL